jgi:hypothetical protein
MELQEVLNTALELADIIIAKRPYVQDTSISKSMKRVINKMIMENNTEFNSMMIKIIVSGNIEIVMSNIIDDVFFDGKVNWGRIATVYAFSSFIVNSLKNNPIKENELETLSSSIGKQVGNKCGTWIVKQGGWIKFVNYFDEHNNIVFNALTIMMSLIFRIFN